MRPRLAPSARRMAISRVRSAARAVNRLPRLAQAASRINPASSINAVRNARVAGPLKSPKRPGRAKPNLNLASVWG